MGNLDVSSYGPLLGALPLSVVAFVAFAWLARPSTCSRWGSTMLNRAGSMWR